jgi:hypothetical protein
MSGTASLDSMSGAVTYIRREYGEHYSIGLVWGSYGAGGLYEVHASDGSRFEIVSDAYGNVYRCCDADCRDEGTYRMYVGAGAYLCDRHAR